MIIHVRLRPEVDGDISAWYEAQTDKSDCVRQVLRSYIEHGNGNENAALSDIVGAAVQRAMGDLQGMVKAAVREALSSYRLTLAASQAQVSAEDPELAARLDAGLDEFFGGD